MVLFYKYSTEKPELLPRALVLLLLSLALAYLCRLAASQCLAAVKYQIYATAFFIYLLFAGSLIIQTNSLYKQLSKEARIKAGLLHGLMKGAEEADSKLQNLSTEELAKELNAAMQMLEQAQEAIVDCSPEIVCFLDSQCNIREIAGSAEKLLKRPALSLIGSPFFALFVREEKAKIEAALDQCRSGNPLSNEELRAKDALGGDLYLSWHLEWSASRKGFYCIGKDISAAKELERLKAEISSMVSHDLRAPISSLSFFLDGLSQGQYGQLDQTGRKQVLSLQDSLKQMLRLISQILDAEKIDSGSIAVELKITPLQALIEDSCTMLQGLALSKEIKLQAAESDFLVHADYDRSLQVLNNLISNAIKWSPEKSQIEIRALKQDAQIRIEIKDQGPGIAESEQDSIFERFKTGQAGKDSKSGAGLGLYICKKLLNLQGGSIGVSRNADGGSLFWFSLKEAFEDELPGYLD